MKKKILALTLVVVLAATAVIGGTLAYFTDTDDATNTFTVGNVKIDLVEEKWDDIGAEDAPSVYPGEVLDKDPVVKNEGENPCFVRVKVTGWDCLAPFGNIGYKTDYVLNKLGDGWFYSESDQYYYYNKVLATGESTDALFDQIVIPTDLENNIKEDGTPEIDLTKEFNLVVSAEAVQAQGALGKNWDGVKAMTPAEIVEWFGIVMATEAA